jgi:hypothetical protein
MHENFTAEPLSHPVKSVVQTLVEGPTRSTSSCTMAEECEESAIITYLVSLLLLFISFALGCTQKWEDFMMVVKHEKVSH